MGSSHRRPSGRLRWTIAAILVLGLIPAYAALAEDDHGGFHHGFGHGITEGLLGNPDCTLTVPASPLSAAGLATPYVLNSAGLACAEDQATGAFVQATILDPATGQVSVYDPEVITPGQTAPTPDAVTLPRHAVVGIWVGFNANVLKLTGPGAREFVNFAQQSYDNAPGTFAALNQAVQQGKLAVPPLGTASDGLACPSSRDFSLVDQDQSDNVPVTYGYAGDAANGSDEQLLDLVDAALGCAVWRVPNLDPAVTADPGSQPDGMLQELQASYDQQFPVALVPALDPFVTTDGQAAPAGRPDLARLNLYRLQVDQPFTFRRHDTAAYCAHLAGPHGAGRLAADYQAETAAAAPAFAPIGTNLANVLAGRFSGTWTLLTCTQLTGLPNPVSLTIDPVSGQVTAAAYVPQASDGGYSGKH